MRIKKQDIKMLTITYLFESKDPEVEPVKAGLAIEFTDEVIISNKMLVQIHDNVSQAFKEMIETEVH